MSWDNFLDEAEAGSGTHYQRCGVALLFEKLSGEEAETLEKALKRPELTSSSIMAAIKRRVDTKVSEYTLRRHRKGICSCSKNGQ